MIQWLAVFSNVFLNPIILMVFLFVGTVFNDVVSVKQTDNVSRLKLLNYGAFCILVTVGLYFFSLLYNRFTLVPCDFISLYHPRYVWINILTALMMVTTLKVYHQGMEANVFGFIFMPLLLLAAGVHIAINVSSLVHHFHFGVEVIDLNIWITIAIHLFNPFLILLVLQTPTKEEDIVDLHWLGEAFVTGFTVLMFYVFWTACHWLAFKLMGKSFDLHQFLGKGQTIDYYLPFIGGGVIFILYHLTLASNTDIGKIAVWLPAAQIILGFVVLASWALLLLNYVKFLYKL